MPALNEILTALARSGHWGCVGPLDGLNCTRWTRTTDHVVQTLDVHWTAHTTPRLHHAWLTTVDTTNRILSEARFDHVPALVRALIEDKA